MGRHSTGDARRIGPKLWPRFLKRHFACPRLATLNAQLLLPITPFEVFEFGVNPDPTPERRAPKIFDRAYDLGRNPDGLYTPELYDPDSRFNLYERVTLRVPESKYWLLKELDHFLRPDPPAIDKTLPVLRELLADLKLVVLERHAIVTWARTDKESLAIAERLTFDALGNSPLPECLALTYCLGHLTVWREAPPAANSLPDRLIRLGFEAARTFALSLESHGFDDGHEIGIALAHSLYEAGMSIKRHGARSMSSKAAGPPPDLALHLVLVPDTVAARRAIVCLTEAAELSAFDRDPWLPLEPVTFLEILENRAKPQTTGLTPLEASMQLGDAAAQVPLQLKELASRNLGGYQGIRSGARNTRMLPER